MMLAQYKYTVGTFPNRINAEHALNVLTTSGIQTDQISIFIMDAEHGEQFGEVGIGTRVWYTAHDMAVLQKLEKDRTPIARNQIMQPLPRFLQHNYFSPGATINSKIMIFSVT